MSARQLSLFVDGGLHIERPRSCAGCSQPGRLRGEPVRRGRPLLRDAGGFLLCEPCARAHRAGWRRVLAGRGRLSGEGATL
jgi:hypothetical protein